MMLPRNTFRLVCGLAAAALLLAGLRVHAQEAVTLDALQIQLWPEFDRPAMLVILSGTLGPDVSLPTSLSVRIPAGAGQPHAVATRDAGGNLLNAPFTTQSAGDALVVTIALNGDNFHLEYYDPTLVISGDAREYTFQWTSDYPVQAANVWVQQPVGAQDLSLEPQFSPAGLGEFGLNYYSSALGSLAAGQRVTVRLTYAKSDASLSADAVGAQSLPLAASVEPTASAPPSPWLIGGLIAGAVLLVGGAGWYLWAYRQERGEGRPAPVRRGRRAPSGEQQPSASRAGYCTQCGQALQTGDVFCRNCGARVRPV